MPFADPYVFTNPFEQTMLVRIGEYEFTLEPGESTSVSGLTGREFPVSVTIGPRDRATPEPASPPRGRQSDRG